jgi:hypothetical protein
LLNTDLNGFCVLSRPWPCAPDSCEENEVEFEETRKAFLRGELKEFLILKGTIEAVRRRLQLLMLIEHCQTRRSK